LSLYLHVFFSVHFFQKTRLTGNKSARESMGDVFFLNEVKSNKGFMERLQGTSVQYKILLATTEAI